MEYLPPLQSTHKWNVHQTNIEPGTIVLLKEENLTRGKSPLARTLTLVLHQTGLWE